MEMKSQRQDDVSITGLGRTREESLSRPLPLSSPIGRLRRRFRSPSPVLMNGQRRLNYGMLNPQHHGRKDNRHRIQMALHLHNTTHEGSSGYLIGRSQKRAESWWSDNISDFQRLSPVPLSTKIIFTESAKPWISRKKDAPREFPSSHCRNESRSSALYP